MSNSRKSFATTVETHCNASLQKQQQQRQQQQPSVNQKFRGRYRISSARLPGYDYSQNGAYFVTVCTKERKHFFGKIVNDKMQLSEIGKIAGNEWEKTANIRKNVKLGEWVVMPNHFHGVVVIENAPFFVETHCNASLRKQQQGNEYHNKFGPQSNNLSAIIRGFKAAATKQIRIAGFHNFSWQPRFYDRIIRNEDELERISDYIVSNPQNWRDDDYFE